MGWAVGYDSRWKRDIGYGVPALCDRPGCGVEIDRGLGFVCTDEMPYGGDDGCGLYFCAEHRGHECAHEGFTPSPDLPIWQRHKLTDDSWARWRAKNPADVQALQAQLENAP